MAELKGVGANESDKAILFGDPYQNAAGETKSKALVIDANGNASWDELTEREPGDYDENGPGGTWRQDTGAVAQDAEGNWSVQS